MNKMNKNTMILMQIDQPYLNRILQFLWNIKLQKMLLINFLDSSLCTKRLEQPVLVAPTLIPGLCYQQFMRTKVV